MGEGSGRGLGRVRLLVSNRGLGRVNVSPGRVQEKWPVDNSDTSAWFDNDLIYVITTTGM